MKWFLVLILWWLQLADVLTTRAGLAMGATEGNPLMAPIIDDWLIVVMKLVLVPLALALLMWAYGLATGDHKKVPWGMWAVVAIYGVVVTNNLVVLTQVAGGA